MESRDLNIREFLPEAQIRNRNVFPPLFIIIHVSSYNQPHYQYEQESIIPPSTSKTQIKPKAKSKTMSFEPKQKVDLDPPKDDIITLEYLSKCDGEY